MSISLNITSGMTIDFPPVLVQGLPVASDFRDNVLSQSLTIFL